MDGWQNKLTSYMFLRQHMELCQAGGKELASRAPGDAWSQEGLCPAWSASLGSWGGPPQHTCLGPPPGFSFTVFPGEDYLGRVAQTPLVPFPETHLFPVAGQIREARALGRV